MATAQNGRVILTRREERILRRAQRALDQLDIVAAAHAAPPRPALNYSEDFDRAATKALERPSRAPKWLQRLIVRRALRKRPQEAAAFAVGVVVGVALVLLAVGVVSEAAR